MKLLDLMGLLYAAHLLDPKEHGGLFNCTIKNDRDAERINEAIDFIEKLHSFYSNNKSDPKEVRNDKLTKSPIGLVDLNYINM